MLDNFINIKELPLPERFSIKSIKESNTGNFLAIMGHSHAIYLYHFQKRYFIRFLNQFSDEEITEEYKTSQAKYQSCDFDLSDKYFACHYNTEYNFGNKKQYLSFIEIILLEHNTETNKPYSNIFKQQFNKQIHFIKFIVFQGISYLLINFLDKTNILLDLNNFNTISFESFKYYSYSCQQQGDLLLLENRQMFSIYNLSNNKTIGVANKFTPLYHKDFYQSIQLVGNKIYTLDPINCLIQLNIISSRVVKKQTWNIPWHVIRLSKEELKNTFVGCTFNLKIMKALLVFRLSTYLNSQTRLYEIDLNTNQVIPNKTALILSKYTDIKGIYYSQHHNNTILINGNSIIFYEYK